MDRCGFGRLVGPVRSRVCDRHRSRTNQRPARWGTPHEGLTNVTVIEGAVNRTNLPAGCCDAILVRDASRHLTQPEDIVRSLSAALKPGGRLAVIDFLPRPNTEVPAGVPANRRGHGVPPEVVQSEVGAALAHVQRSRRGRRETSPPRSISCYSENLRSIPRPGDSGS